MKFCLSELCSNCQSKARKFEAHSTTPSRETYPVMRNSAATPGGWFENAELRETHPRGAQTKFSLIAAHAAPARLNPDPVPHGNIPRNRLHRASDETIRSRKARKQARLPPNIRDVVTLTSKPREACAVELTPRRVTFLKHPMFSYSRSPLRSSRKMRAHHKV